MKKVFLALVTQTVGTLLGMAAWSVQAQMLPGPFAVPTDGGGTPIYANQEGYYGLSGGCSDGKCGYRAVGSVENAMMFHGSAVGAPVSAPAVGVPFGAPCAPCQDVCGPCLPAPCLPCLPCLPAFVGCGPCGSGILAKIWNGPYYWQGPGCSERVIDELRKSWRTPCPQCDIYGETITRSPNSIGTGLRSAQIVGAGAPYGPIKMNAGQPENGYYSVPVNRNPAPFQPGGCSSCQKGITVTAAQTYAQPTQTYAQPTQTYAQPVPNRNIQPVQYVEPIQRNANQPIPQTSRFSGTMRYRTNYTPSNEVPGYVRAQRNAEKTGIGFDSIPQNGNSQSAWRSTANRAAESNQVQAIPVSTNSRNIVIPVDYQQNTAQLETIPAPAPRPSGSVLTSGPIAEAPETVPTAYPSPYPAMEADCGIPCADPCVPCAEPCGPCLPCGPCFGGGCWPGLIPLAADAVRFTGRAAFRVGRAAVVGTGMALCGSARAVGFVFWNRPFPAPICGGPICGGPWAGPWGGDVVGPAPMIDPVYAQNDFYLNASAAAPAGSSVNPNSGLMAGNSSASVVPNLYENGFYPQNYSVISDTAVGTLPNSGYGNAAQMASDSPLNAPALSIEAAPAAEWSQTAGTETYGTGTAALLTTQTQRVCLEDGTEVILEHDAMIPENRALNPSAQFASTNDSSVSAPRTAISTGNSSAVIPVSAAVPDPVLKTAELKPAESLVRTASLTEEQIVSFASEQNDVKRTPAPAENLSTDGYPIVVAENPQIQLAPGEVLISQEDFILEPVEESKEETNDSILIPVNDAAGEILESVPEKEKTVSPVVKPIRDESVTKVSFVEPIILKKETFSKMKPETQSISEKPIKSVKMTDSGWQIIER